MAYFRERNDGEDAFISSIPSPPYSEDGNDQDERMGFRSDEHFDNALNQSDINKKSIFYEECKTISKHKFCNTDKFHNTDVLQRNFLIPLKKHVVKEKMKNRKLAPHSKYEKIYPNLSKICSPNTKSQISGSQTKSSGIYKKVKCYVCDQNVENIHLRDHLLFGALECCDCGWKEDDCYSFRKHFGIGRKTEEGCHHEELRWLCDPLNFLTKVFIKKEGIAFQNKKLLDSFLERYLNCIVDRWDIRPWNSAIDLCRIYLSSISSKYNQLMSSVIPEQKKAKKGTHLLDLPADGRYYICKEVIEECRECYSKLNIQDLQFYVSTALITTKCRNCDLSIYFVLPPPNGAKPFLEITLS